MLSVVSNFSSVFYEQQSVFVGRKSLLVLLRGDLRVETCMKRFGSFSAFSMQNVFWIKVDKKIKRYKNVQVNYFVFVH